MISEIHHVALSVRDLERSLAFYCDVLGFKKSLDLGPSDPERNARLLETPPGTRTRSAMLRKARSTVGMLELIEFDPPAPRPVGPLRAGDPGVFLLAFEVTGEDLDAIHARLVERGIRCHGSGPEEVDIPGYGAIRSLIFRDPDGVMLELVTQPVRP